MAEIDDTKDARLRTRLGEVAVSFRLLPISEESRELAQEYARQGAVPSDYPEDALHMAIATVNGIDYLLSWNFEHIVKIKTRRIINMVNASRNYRDLQIATPWEII